MTGIWPRGNFAFSSEATEPGVTGVTALALRAAHASAIKMARNGSS